MKWMRAMGAIIGAAMLAQGCAHSKPEAGTEPSLRGPKPVVTPDLRPIGRVTSVNTNARFVVVTFDSSPMPEMSQQLGVYHGGVKVGEVKITGPQRENNVVADLIVGEAHEQDEVRPD